MLDNQKIDTTSQKRTIDKSQATRLKDRPLTTLRNFKQKDLLAFRNDKDFFLQALDQAKMLKHQEYLAKMLMWAYDLIFHKHNEGNFSKVLATYTRRYSLDQDLNQGPAPAIFDDYLCGLVEKVWPYALQLVDHNFIDYI